VPEHLGVLFVCLGNICRSPTAEGVFRHLVEAAALEKQIEADSAGTGDWHVGSLPDPRTIAAARRRGYRLQHRARQLVSADLDRFDFLVAMDHDNLVGIARIAGNRTTRATRALLRSFDPTAKPTDEVPDPYTGGRDGFELVLDQCERACRGLLEHVRSRFA
jgi:protein-tyrosine phosphatase